MTVLMTKQLLFMLATFPAMVSRRQFPKKEFQIGIRLTLYQEYLLSPTERDFLVSPLHSFRDEVQPNV